MSPRLCGLQADDRPRPLPLVHASRLQPLSGEPQANDILAYRLLEIGDDFTPQVRFEHHL